MTLVEGYAEHVMDAVGDQLDPGYTELRRALDSDRDRRGLLDSIVSKVLGPRDEARPVPARQGFL